MNKIFIYFLLSIISTISMAKTLVTVNGQKIDSSIVDKEVNILKKQKNIPDTKELRTAILDTIITSVIVTQEAKNLKLDQSKEYKDTLKKAIEESKKNGDIKKEGFKESLEFFKEQLLMQTYVSYIANKNPISDEQSKKFYDEFKKYYTNTKEVKLGNIFTKSKDDANKALNELKKGTKFEDVAKKYSIVNDAKSNGGIAKEYINLKDIKNLDNDMYNIISKLKKGKNSNVIYKNNLYGILYLDDIRTISIKSYNEMKNQIINQLKYQKVQESIDKLVKKAKIDKN